MGSNISVLQRGNNLAGPAGPSRVQSRQVKATRASAAASTVPGTGDPGTGQDVTHVSPTGQPSIGTVPPAAPGKNPPSPDPSSYLVPGTVTQTPFGAPLQVQQQQQPGILAHTSTIFGYTLPTVVWVGAGAVALYVLYQLFLKEEKRR